MVRKDPKRILDEHIAHLSSKLPTYRTEIIQRHLPTLHFPPMIEQKNLDSVIRDIIKKDVTYPPIYLASLLSFTKTNWNRSIEKLLGELGLVNRLKYPTMKNMKKYEKLKFLILKYLEMKNKG